MNYASVGASSERDYLRSPTRLRALFAAVGPDSRRKKNLFYDFLFSSSFFYRYITVIFLVCLYYNSTPSAIVPYKNTSLFVVYEEDKTERN